MSKPIKGSCLCGAVVYEIVAPFKAFRYCHCPRCRKHTGSAHASNLFVVPTQFKWMTGEQGISRFDLPEAERFARCFCQQCGSPVPSLSRDGTYVVVPAGSLDDDPQAVPEHSIYWEARAPWYRGVNDIPCFAKLPPKPS